MTQWANIGRLTLMLRDGGHLVRLATASNDRSEDDGAETSLAPPCPFYQDFIFNNSGNS